MLLEVLQHFKIPAKKYSLVPIRDINRSSLWVKHVQNTLPSFEMVFSGSDLVKHLFSLEKNLKIVSLHKRKKISASEIRKKMLHNEKWENLVPKCVQKFLKKINATQRLQKINNF